MVSSIGEGSLEGCISNQIIKHSSWPPKLCKKLLKGCSGRVTQGEGSFQLLPAWCSKLLDSHGCPPDAAIPASHGPKPVELPGLAVEMPDVLGVVQVLLGWEMALGQ